MDEGDMWSSMIEEDLKLEKVEQLLWKLSITSLSGFIVSRQ